MSELMVKSSIGIRKFESAHLNIPCLAHPTPRYCPMLTATGGKERYDHQTPAQRESALDEDGRTKLLASVSRGSIAMFFFVLMWRAVHHYELADASFKGPFRLMMVVPTVALFVGNMSGCVASLTSPSHSAKKRMKAILNLNKLVEILLFAYNLSRLTMFTSKFVPREIYVGRTLTNFLFLVQCQLFTRVTWGAAQAGHEAAAATGGPAAWSEEVSQGGAASYVSSTGAEATTAKGYGHSSGYEPSEAQQAGVSSQRQYEEGGEEWT